ncbi:MAG: hypothetical protein O3A29_03110 [Planctomycetota bacterium]|nr:hypothetical protein [Planctomycetota bacterium]
MRWQIRMQAVPCQQFVFPTTAEKILIFENYFIFNSDIGVNLFTKYNKRQVRAAETGFSSQLVC